MTVELLIDGQQIICQENITILEAAKRADISIPTLCHIKGKRADQPCEVCAVEVKGRDGFIMSCSEDIAQGMDVSTDSPALRAHRKKGSPISLPFILVIVKRPAI